MSDTSVWVTRETGDFEARPVTPGRVRALVRHPEYVEGQSELVSVAPGGEARVRVVLSQGGELEGRVLDDRGFPLANVQVEVAAERGTFQRTSLTASDGTFAFAAVPEAVVVSLSRAEDPARIALVRPIKVPEGTRQDLELTLPAPRDTVHLAVFGERETPIELAEVHVTSLDRSVPLRQTLFTDREGHAELPDALGLPLRVVVDAPGFAVVERTLDPAPSEVRIALDPGVLVAGKVTAVRGRRFLAGALVTLRAGSQRKSTMTDRDGAFRFGAVPEGAIEIDVSHPDYADAKLTTRVTRTGRVDRAFELPTLDLTEAAQIEGEVLDNKGQPVEGARVAAGLVPAYLPAGALPKGVVLTDARGGFTLTGLAEGAVRVSAHAPGIGRGSVDNVSVSSGRTTRGVVVRLTEPVNDDTSVEAANLAVTLGERGSGAALEVVLADVASSSQAERGGLQVGDVLRAIDGERPRSMVDARARLAGREGTDVVIDVLRAGAPLRLRVSREAVRR
jgi:hypothetical protein